MSSSSNPTPVSDQLSVENPVIPTQNALDSSEQRSVNGDMSMSTHTPALAVAAPPTIVDPFAALTQSFTPKRAVSYIRVSTREQAEKGGLEEGFSIPAQREANKKKAQSIGAMISKEFVERGVSGTSTNRPALQEMLRYLKDQAEDIDYVIVHKLDRLARNRADDVEINKQLDGLGIRLISTSENIDQTPGGLLLHGIMSSIAEFYSKNLSNEVIKGMSEKARNGGTPGRAPIGYLNVRTVENGREARTVIVDETRAPLIKWAFEAYATGEWTMESLGKELTRRGLRTVPTARMSELPIQKRQLDNVLNNPYYTGTVIYQGVEYPGNHTPLISRDTFETVQAVLRGKLKGERSRKHEHYLKSTVFCGHCGSRLIIQKARSGGNGDIYEYFSCSGRLAKRTKCNLRSIQFDVLEDKIQAIYQRISIDPDLRQNLEAMVRSAMKTVDLDNEEERKRLETERVQIQRKQKKLLEAHYNDAIPVELLREEQQRLEAEHLSVTRSLDAQMQSLKEMDRLITLVLDIVEDLAHSYQVAPSHVRRMLNQLIFERLDVFFDHGEMESSVEPRFTEAFAFLGQREIRVAANEFALQRKEPAVSDRLFADVVHSPNALSSAYGSSKSLMVREGGLEPPRPRTLEPKSSASADSATRAQRPRAPSQLSARRWFERPPEAGCRPAPVP